MDVLYLKVILLAAMFLVALVFGFLPIKVYSCVKRLQTEGRAQLSSLLLSLLSCLAGGVFLGVCLLDLLPFASETFESAKEAKGYGTDYPLVELLIGGGFFFVYLVEELSLKVFNYDDRHEHSGEHDACKGCQQARDMQMAATAMGYPQNTEPRLRASSMIVVAKERIADVDSRPVAAQSEKGELVKSLAFIAAFTFHSCLEGFAFGVQPTSVSAASLFFGIIVHKAVVAFSIGMRLVRAHPHRTVLIATFIIVVALTAPAGGAIGIAVEDSAGDSVTKDIVSSVLTSVALGTFLYITFFEILYAEQANGKARLLQWLSTFVGFSIIAVIMIFGD